MVGKFEHNRSIFALNELPSTNIAPMITGSNTRDIYLGLTKHTAVQVVVFLFTCVLFTLCVYAFVGAPLVELFMVKFLHARVEMLQPDGHRLLSTWIITTEEEGGLGVFYLNPLLALLPLCIALGLIVAFYLSAVLPKQVGFIRQKILREIVNSLDSMARIVYQEHLETDSLELENRLLDLNPREMHDIAATHPISYDRLQVLRNAVEWRKASPLIQLVGIQDGVRLYLRDYFTIQYGNVMLGIVYIGAAVLIAVIGLRGLKFIPASEPSIIIFALSLEFVLLLVYALTVMYTTDEDEQKTGLPVIAAPEPHTGAHHTGGGAASARVDKPSTFGHVSDETIDDTQRLLRIFLAAGKTEEQQ